VRATWAEVNLLMKFFEVSGERRRTVVLYGKGNRLDYGSGGCA
jgi:hypothetical protein